jgi:hypothetical protein
MNRNIYHTIDDRAAIFTLTDTAFAYLDLIQFLDQLAADQRITRWRRVEGGRTHPLEIAVAFESDRDAVLAKLHWR